MLCYYAGTYRVGSIDVLAENAERSLVAAARRIYCARRAVQARLQWANKPTSCE